MPGMTMSPSPSIDILFSVQSFDSLGAASARASVSADAESAAACHDAPHHGPVKGNVTPRCAMHDSNQENMCIRWQ